MAVVANISYCICSIMNSPFSSPLHPLNEPLPAAVDGDHNLTRLVNKLQPLVPEVMLKRVSELKFTLHRGCRHPLAAAKCIFGL